MSGNSDVSVVDIPFLHLNSSSSFFLSVDFITDLNDVFYGINVKNVSNWHTCLFLFVFRPRGFGQLVRAKNIKTVGDLSALTPSEIKSLPIRSPKLSNVRKALKIYHEQQVIVHLYISIFPFIMRDNFFSHLAVQRKGRSDDLKSFDEMEKMTSEPEEIELPQNQEEEQTPGEVQG